MWVYVAVFVISLLLTYNTVSKAETKPPGFGDVEMPTVEVGIEIPVLFGTRDLKSPNVVWYGDLKVVAVKAKGGKK